MREIGVRHHTHEDKDAVAGVILFGFGLDVLELDRLDLAFAFNRRGDRIVLNDQIGVGLVGLGQQLFDEDLVGTELIAPVDYP